LRSPRGVLALVETIQLGRAVTQRGELSFFRYCNPNFNRKFQISLVKNLTGAPPASSLKLK